MPVPSNLVLRPVRADEVEALADLWHAGWRIGHADIVPEGLLQHRSRDMFRDRILDSLDSCFVTGGLTGFVRLKGDELDQFYVAPAAIGQGVAAALMVAAEALMQQRGTVQAWLIASVGNTRAMRFYARQGWRAAGQVSMGVETATGPFMMDVIRFEKRLVAVDG